MAFSCFLCGHEFDEGERQYTVVATPLGLSRGRNRKVCRDCFLQIAADEEDAEEDDDGV